MPIEAAKLIPWLPALAAVLCGLCCARRAWRVWAAPVCIASLASSFLIAWSIQGHVSPDAAEPVKVLHLFDWMNVGGFGVGFGYYIDPLTLVMLGVVTGVGTLVAIYAAGYMAGDRGYARFFAGVSLFIFAMTTLVMADNLVLMYLGWEGVGLCSYLLIGYYYTKPSAVAAAKKAFIVNRIGDLGFALGIMLTYHEFGTVRFAGSVVDGVRYAGLFEQCGLLSLDQVQGAVKLIPFLFMLGAIGKSAQLPLYVWLPDAMEGPTPVSALIHAATMVTAGVYMIARLLPVFELSAWALPTVAVVGGATALFAALIALCQYDIKRIYAYSTISQLGYMFLGVGVLSSVGAVFHLLTHAFFKALLFLTAGSVMHAMAGQLDLRKMSGLRGRLPVTCWLMFAGCLALAGFPFTAGFYSKDMILVDALARGLTEHKPLFTVLALVGLFTAFLTAYYTFRLWFRLFMGPTAYELGDEHAHHGTAGNGAEGHTGGSVGASGGSGGATSGGGIRVERHHDVHEVGWLMNGPLVVLAVGALFAGMWAEHWVRTSVLGSTARPLRHLAEHGGHGAWMGLSAHHWVLILGSSASVVGIATAAYYHWLNRKVADRLAERHAGLVRVLANKFYVDELYQAAVVGPLRAVGHLCYEFDRLVVDGLVATVGFVPRLLGISVRVTQRGVLQGYGIGMAIGTVVVVLWVLWVY